MSREDLTGPTRIAVFLAVFLPLGPGGVLAEDWRQFRGENAAGVYAARVPTEGGDEQNLKWVLPLPGKGVSSPIVVGDRVFVTAFSGFGQDVNNPVKIENLRRHLGCIERQTGTVLWQRRPPTR